MKSGKTKKIVLMAILFALALILSVVEGMLPVIPIPIQGIKLGLSNVVVMFALFFIEYKTALAIAVLKAIFIVMTRGVVAGLLSATGGVLSVLVMMSLQAIFKDKISYTILSIFGAISHNIGQFIVFSMLYMGMNLWFYLPVLVISGVIMGVLTSILLRASMPALKNIANINLGNKS